MATFKNNGLVSVGETYTMLIFKRLENSDYEWEEFPSFKIRCRIAQSMETRTYRIQLGVNGNDDNLYIVATNLPQEVAPQDKVLFMGKIWSVESIGYYFNQNNIVNGAIMSDEFLVARCPKGLTLK